MNAENRNFPSPAGASSPAFTCTGSGREGLIPMKEISLSNGKVALVDDEDYERISKFRWTPLTGKHNTYARTRPDKHHVILMHRVIVGATGKQEVDHRDHNGLNNQKQNLRLCFRTQNSRNQRIRRNNTSGFKGVSFFAPMAHRPWMAYIKVNYQRKHLGYFSTPVEAAIAYNQAALKYFGEYAHPNTI